MTKRALLCGLGKAYSKTQLPPLPLEEDLKCVIERLNSTGLTDAWESIDVIDDSPKSVFTGEKNQVAMANDLMASKENIIKSLNEIAAKGADLILFYYSGHGDVLGNTLYMITYDPDFFSGNIELSSAEVTNLFLKDSDYNSCIDNLLTANTELIIITIIDSCFSSSIRIGSFKPNVTASRHLIFASGQNEARTNLNTGSLFTNGLMNAAKSSSTYATLKKNIENGFGSPQKPTINVDKKYDNINIPF